MVASSAMRSAERCNISPFTGALIYISDEEEDGSQETRCGGWSGSSFTNDGKVLRAQNSLMMRLEDKDACSWFLIC